MDMAASPRKCTPCVVPMHVCGGPNTFVVFFSLFAVLCYVSPSKDRSRAYCVRFSSASGSVSSNCYDMPFRINTYLLLPSRNHE